MDDLIVQFARLWGQRETFAFNEKEEKIAEMLKGYDSEELLQLLQAWAEEYASLPENSHWLTVDTVDFFERKIEEMFGEEE